MSKPDLDIDAARKLLGEISDDLAQLPSDTRHARLRTEVAQLRSMLDRAESTPPQVREGMTSVHSKLDEAAAELQTDGVRAGLFLQGIARMLGLD